MADAMDLAQLREQKTANATSATRVAVSLHLPVFSAKNVTNQSRKLAALRFRVWPLRDLSGRSPN